MTEILIYIFGDNLKEIIANIAGYIAIAILIYGFGQKDDIRSIKLISISIIFWAINYTLLGLYGAVIATVIGSLRMYFSLKYKGNMYAVSIVLLLNFIFGFFVYNGIISILPILAGVISVLAYQIYTGIIMRIYLMLFSIIWLVYMSILGNIPGVINEIITLGVLSFTIYRMSIGSIDRITYKQKLIFILKRLKPRSSVDFDRFTVLRDVKRYFNKNILVDYKKKETL